MLVNLLTLTGGMVGVDLHVYQIPPATPWMNIHFTAQVHLAGTYWNVAWTNGMCGAPPLQEGFFMEIVPHVPFPMPMGPGEPVLLGWTIALGTSQPMFVIHHVSGDGKKLLGEVHGSFGNNANCGFWPFTASNIDYSINTVQVAADAEDLAKYNIEMEVEAIYNSAAAALALLPGGGPLRPGPQATTFYESCGDMGNIAGAAIALWQNGSSVANRYGPEDGPPTSLDGALSAFLEKTHGLG